VASQTRHRIEISSEQAELFSRRFGNGQNILISTHISPDGDAIASLLGVAEIVRSLKSRAICCLQNTPPDRYDFLLGFDQIVTPVDLKDCPFSAALIVDCGNLNRIGEVEKLISGIEIIGNIDHHADNQNFGSWNLLCPKAASTTEILYELANSFNLPFHEGLATCFYTGLFTDTGGFRYSNTDANALRIGAELASKGVDVNGVAVSVYGRNPESAVRMIGEAIHSLETYSNGTVAMMTVLVPENGEEVENLVDYAANIKGIRAAALFRVGENEVRVSLRGRDNINVASVARHFGGGGHPKAAGFTGREDIEKLRMDVLAALTKEIESHNYKSVNQS
jgi:bifunctional oligoribonuclease and PAP phosphatase NrnA